MKTLSELWKENGEKPGMMIDLAHSPVRDVRYNPRIVHGKTRKGKFIVEDNECTVHTWVEGHEPASLHVPPKPKVIRAQYILRAHGGMPYTNEIWFESDKEVLKAYPTVKIIKRLKEEEFDE